MTVKSSALSSTCVRLTITTARQGLGVSTSMRELCWSSTLSCKTLKHSLLLLPSSSTHSQRGIVAYFRPCLGQAPLLNRWQSHLHLACKDVPTHLPFTCTDLLTKDIRTLWYSSLAQDWTQVASPSSHFNCIC